MLTSKSDSLAQEFEKVRNMLTVITNEKHLVGFEGAKDSQLSEQQMREEEIKAEIA
jgi:hypothetical protein